MPNTTIDLNMPRHTIWTQVSKAQAQPIVYTNGVQGYWGQYRKQRVTNNTPGYRMARGKLGRNLPMQNFYYVYVSEFGWEGEQEWSSISAPPESLYGSFGVRHGASDRTYPTIPGIFDPFTQAQKDALDSECRIKALLALKKQSVNLAQAYAERAQARNMFIKNAERIAWCGYYLSHGKFGLAADALGVKVRKRAQRRYNRALQAPPPKGESRLGQQERALASGWLELQYGWKPLLQDLYGICEFIADAQYAPDYGKITAKRTLQHVYNDVTKTTDYGGTTFTRSGNAKYSVKYTLYYGTSVPTIHNLSSLGITNPALIAWELTPFSFVVDWFLPIGNWLGSFDATLGLSFTKGCKTTFAKREGTVMARQFQVKQGDTLYTTDLQKRGAYTTCVRDVLTSFPNTGRPTFKNPISVGHMANALALLTQIFKKR